MSGSLSGACIGVLMSACSVGVACRAQSIAPPMVAAGSANPQVQPKQQPGAKSLRKAPVDAHRMAAPAPPVVLPDPPTPVVQARQIGLDQCASLLNSMSHETLTTTYDVQSGWSQGAPAKHVFQSVAVLTKRGNSPPDGLAALIAAPLGGGTCDGVILQVFPLAGDCANAQRILLAGGGKTLGPIVNANIMVDAAGRRLFLLPGASKTCIAIAVDSRFASP